MAQRRSASFYCSQLFNCRTILSLIWINMLIKRYSQDFLLELLVLIVNRGDIYSFSPLSRWKYGSRISAPSIKRSWSMAADQRENISTARAQSLPARPACPNSGKSPWGTKEATCTQTLTWTVLATGIQTATLTRTRCPGLRWCEWLVFGGVQPTCSDL